MKKFLLLLFAFLIIFPLPASAEVPLPEEGDVLLFGRYEQDGDPDNGPEPIQWLVLDADEETLLLITEYEIAYRSYSNRRDELVSWEDSDLRTWLNDQFLAFAFSEEERSFIAETPLHTPGGKHTITRNLQKSEVEAPECDTIDRVFVLSEEETERYFSFGSTDPRAVSEHRVSLPVYGLQLKLAMDGDTYWEEAHDCPYLDEYTEMTSHFHPLATQTEDGWALHLPWLEDYSQFWQDMDEYYIAKPWLLREHGMRYSNNSDGSGDTGWYDWYCWDRTCIRPALRISRAALDQGLVIQPRIVTPYPADPELVGIWKATQDGQTAYYCFDSDGYHLQIKATFEDQTVSADLLYEANGHNLIMAQIGYQGQLVNVYYEVEEDTMIIRHGEETISFERTNEIELS